MTMERMGVTLLSGGLDSTTVTAYAKSRLQRLTALTFHYGQSHSKEVRCAGAIARVLGIQHELVDISGFGKAAWYSSLTSPERFDRPEARPIEEIGRDAGESGPSIPNTYVPLRNTLFLTIAAAFLESLALHAIEARRVEPREIGAYIFIGPNAIDYSGYPDCRPEYYEKMREALMFGSKLWAQYDVPIHIETPIITLSKGEIVKLGIELDAPLEQTWSCYSNGIGERELPCGRCDSCILRAKGFAESGYDDPLLLRLGGNTA